MKKFKINKMYKVNAPGYGYIKVVNRTKNYIDIVSDTMQHCGRFRVRIYGDRGLLGKGENILLPMTNCKKIKLFVFADSEI